MAITYAVDDRERKTKPSVLGKFSTKWKTEAPGQEWVRTYWSNEKATNAASGSTPHVIRGSIRFVKWDAIIGDSRFVWSISGLGLGGLVFTKSPTRSKFSSMELQYTRDEVDRVAREAFKAILEKVKS